MLGALALASVGGYIAWRNNFKSRRATACAAFRSFVLAALEGLYPVPSSWPKDTSQNFRLLLPSIALFSPGIAAKDLTVHGFSIVWARTAEKLINSVTGNIYRIPARLWYMV